MSQEPMMDVTSDDKLWAALCYIPYLNQVVPIVVLLMEDKKNHPFLKHHAIQSIFLGLLAYVLIPLCGIGLLVVIYMLYIAYTAYQGQYTRVPLISDFIKNQGWV